jgi:aspartyl-tRNA(Asn)/glutamyl-tRNA(Gln) amidotransferase subunit A
VTDLAWASAAEIARKVATKEISAVEVARACLARLERLDGTLRAFITTCADGALEAARAVDAAVGAGAPPGPLAGVPVGLKDLIDVAGVRTTAGSRILADHVATGDATVTRRLRAAGAIVVGKLNLHEFAFGPDGANRAHGTSRNPWDAAAARIPGGSSSGSGVAVAAGLVAAALGTDTGGSIRIPAALCGITGLKPTYGRVSRAGVRPLAWSLDHLGPMTRTAADAALLLGALAGYDPADPATSVLPVPDYRLALTGDVKGLRVGVLRAFFMDRAAADVAQAVEAAARALEGLGARVDEAPLPSARLMPAASFAILASEALAYHGAWLRERPGDYQPDVRERLRLGAFVGGAQYVRAQQVRALLRAEVDAALAARDVLLAPTVPLAAPRVDEREVAVAGGRVDVLAALPQLTRGFNLSGHPVCSLPCGFTAGGLPIGMQVVGRPFDEATVLRAADAYQRITDWHTRRPPLGV